MNENEILLGIAEDFLKNNVYCVFKEVAKAHIEHKLSLLKDLNTVSSVLLPAVVVFSKDEFIKSKWLFYLGLVGFAGLLVCNFFYQRFLFRQEGNLSDGIARYMEKLNSIITKCKLHGGDDNFSELDKTLKESSANILPRRKNYWFRNAELLLLTLFIGSVFCTTFAMLFRIPYPDLRALCLLGSHINS